MRTDVIADPVRIAGTKMKVMTLPYQVAAATDRGQFRPSNEDAFGYLMDAGVFVVCDGMGGAAAGEVASHASVEAFLGIYSSPRDSEAVDQPTLLREAIAAANEAVYTLAEEDIRLRGMGTTLVALLVEERRAWVAHVGDSRCYRMRKGTLERLTEDHSLVDEQVRRGQITAAEAANSPLRNVITRAIGSHGSVTPEIAEVDVRSGDVLLLCSDGLVREVSDRQIGEVLQAATSVEAACEQLIDAANTNGGKDNITCLVVRAV